MATEPVGPGRVRNEFSGTAGVAVQAGVIHGDVHINAPEVRPPTAVPHQLPAGSGLLAGRDALLARLSDLLLPQGFAVLTGMAGVGKTALVLRWAQANTAAFPDGQLYVDLQGFSTSKPLSAHDALAGFLRALGHVRPEELSTLEERAAHYRTLLSGRRALVVLDNARSVDHVRPLLPGAGPCSIVVISRSRLPGLAIHYAATIVLVEPLSKRDGLILLSQAASEDIDQEASAQLVRYCGGLPLALRIVAQRVASGPVQDVVDELANEQARLDALDAQDDAHSAVRTVFSWSYHGLPGHEAHVFRLLGLHPTTEFGTGAVAAMLRLGPEAATKVMRSLTQRHLALDLGQGRFGLHDLLRTYAAEVCSASETDEERTFLLTLLFDHYLHSADHAGRIVMPHRLRFPLEGRPRAVPALRDRRDALRWFDVERRNLEAMCALDSPALDARTWQLAYTLRDYYFLDKLLDGWRFTHEHALSATLRSGDALAEARTRNNLGMALVQAGRLDNAETHYIRAHELFAQHGDGHGNANALANLASVLRRRGEFVEALRNQQLALSWYRQAGAARNTGITLRSMAMVEMELERFADAVRHVEEALAIAIDLGLDVDAAEGFGRLGRIQHRAGDDAAAEMALRLAVDYSRRSGSRHEEARALHQLGDVAATVGQAADARRWWLDALGLYRDLGSNEAQILTAALAALPADQ